MNDAAQRLADAITEERAGLLLVVTGAGVSRASGISTFRGSEPGAVWKQDDMSLATVEYFQRDPAAQWRWYLRRFDAVEAALPNPAHQALAELERWKSERDEPFLLVTQNIDTLHEQGGSHRMIKIHGTSDRLRCSRHGCELGAPGGSMPRRPELLAAFRREPRRENLPVCPRCGELLRAHVLFFDEYYQEHRDYRFDEVVAAADSAALVLFAGTSFSVGITDLILGAAARRRVPTFSIDPGAAAAPWRGVEALPYPAEEILPDVCRRLAGVAGGVGG